MTLAQSNVFDWMAWEGQDAVFALYADLPAGHTVEEVLEAVGVLTSRHEGLRTVYESDGAAGWTQRVSRSGHVDVLLLELGAAARHRTRITDPPRTFDHGGDFPVRVAVMLENAVPVRAVFEFSHVVADLVAAGIVMDEFVELVAAPQRSVGPPIWQPPDQAEYEQTPEAKRRMAKTLDYWRSQMQELPACLLSVPARTPGPSEYRLAGMRSASLANALQAVSTRTKVTPATILVTTMATLLSWWTDTDRAALDALYSNRALPRMRNFVGSIVQSALVPFACAPSFYETLQETRAAILNAYRYAYFDATAVAQMVDSIGVQRGCPRHRDLIVNDMSTGRGAVFDRRAGAQIGETEVECGLATTAVDPVRLTILQTEPIAVLGLTHDIRHVTNDEAAALLRSLEQVLITAAERDIDIDALGDTIELQRVERDAGWAKVNSSWINVATSEALLREAAGDPNARIFVQAGPGAAASLVGYAAPADPGAGPHELHAAVMAGLGGRHGVVAPDSYLVCATAPQQPESQAAWRAQPVRRAGSGR
ncbi:condensation domain-containing protein [Solwaraspora sp. WMMD1047]|uniref:condensation domain-containing protein n=1 Tax=Solwaraspora sp. WMMD1047 TaxID=3016102 RepID=UPI0024176D79|nr:condensation domain-containing protein [Solwaraspora sp. WMMD1047]MDG4828985.1 condensation domain-containing protein [Solwaraspora sp. WMMD1047]